MSQPLAIAAGPYQPMWRALLILGLFSACWPCVAYGQYPRDVHYFQDAHLPPGTVAAAQALRGGPVVGYMQPTEIRGPEGSLISIAHQGSFTEPQKDVLHVALMVGQVYRLRIGNIPFHEDAEVYPTIEMINRLYPPEGQKLRFPLPIQLSEEELDMAIRGLLVTRVIYIEDPRQAVPEAQTNQQQRVLDVTPENDPLFVADRLGRPMAILRLGSRVPEIDGQTGLCLFDTAPSVLYTPPSPVTLLPRDKALRGLEQLMEPGNYPRVPLPSPAPPTDP